MNSFNNSFPNFLFNPNKTFLSQLEFNDDSNIFNQSDNDVRPPFELDFKESLLGFDNQKKFKETKDFYDEKKELLLSKKRQSARETRERKKKHMILLTQENKALKEKVAELQKLLKLKFCDSCSKKLKEAQQGMNTKNIFSIKKMVEKKDKPVTPISFTPKLEKLKNIKNNDKQLRPKDKIQPNPNLLQYLMLITNFVALSKKKIKKNNGKHML